MVASTALLAAAPATSSTTLRWEQVVLQALERGRAQSPKAKQSRSRDRHAEILSAAVRVFARDGIARARIADIAAEAGVPLSSVYDYYDSKEDIAYAVPIAQTSEFVAEFHAKALKLEGADERLYLFMWLTVDFARRHQDWARTLYLEVWPSVMVNKTRVKDSLDDFGRIMYTLIQDGEQAGLWPADPNRYQTVTIFIGSLSQMIITWLLYKRPRQLMKATAPLVQRLMGLLQTSTPSIDRRRAKN